jgi:5-hydroxyisourate hydrolase
MRSPITTHVLDTALGKPAAGVPLVLERVDDDHAPPGLGRHSVIARGVTDADGRVADLLAPGSLEAGTYRITFDTAAYFAATDRQSFYPSVSVLFEIRDPTQHYHVPLLLSPFGYSTYRGS